MPHMDNQIICPNCKNSIPLTEAISHELREKYKQLVIEDRKKQAELYQKKLQEEKTRLEKELLEQAKKQAEQELSLKLKDSQNETEELKKQNNLLSEQLLETNKLLRQLKQERELEKIENEKKLVEEQEKIKNDLQKRIDEEYRLKMLENEKKLADALRVNDELKRKLEQGSQQTQGEVLELELENILRAEFPLDDIKPVAKGIKGGDIVQIVKNNSGHTCGTIIWETKRTKTWSNEWIPKLKDDQRNIKAEVAIIISEILPPELDNFGWKEGVWVGNFACTVGLAHAVRRNLLEVAMIKTANAGKGEKMELLYTYISGTEFRQRIEAIMEAFTALQDNIEKEKRWFSAKWAKEEKDIRKVLDNTLGMRGDLQSITGEKLTEINGPELLPGSVDVIIEEDTLL